MPKAENRHEVELRLVPGTGNPRTLDDAYRSDCRYVGATILRLNGRPAEVDDLIQDVFVEAAAGIARLREPEAIKGWLATIAVWTVRRRLRVCRTWRLLGLDRDPVDTVAVDPQASPADLAGEASEWNLDVNAPFGDPCVDCAAFEGGSGRVNRGGSFQSSASPYLQSYFRGDLLYPSSRTSSFGFRCARTP